MDLITNIDVAQLKFSNKKGSIIFLVIEIVLNYDKSKSEPKRRIIVIGV